MARVLPFPERRADRLSHDETPKPLGGNLQRLAFLDPPMVDAIDRFVKILIDRYPLPEHEAS